MKIWTCVKGYVQAYVQSFSNQQIYCETLSASRHFQNFQQVVISVVLITVLRRAGYKSDLSPNNC